MSASQNLCSYKTLCSLCYCMWVFHPVGLSINWSATNVGSFTISSLLNLCFFPQKYEVLNLAISWYDGLFSFFKHDLSIYTVSSFHLVQSLVGFLYFDLSWTICCFILCFNSSKCLSRRCFESIVNPPNRFLSKLTFSLKPLFELHFSRS